MAIFIKLRDCASRCCFPAKPWPARTKPPSSAGKPGETPTQEFGSSAKDLPPTTAAALGRVNRDQGLRSEEADLLELERTEPKSGGIWLGEEEGEPLNRRGRRRGKGERIRRGGEAYLMPGRGHFRNPPPRGRFGNLAPREVAEWLQMNE